MIIHESYVSLETAKMLKEAGFDWEGTSYYQHGVFYPYKIDRERLVIMNQSSAPSYMEQYSAPTLDVAQRWLREVKDIEVVVEWCVIFDGIIHPFEKRKYEYTIQGVINMTNFSYGEVGYDTYEEAQEAGIKKVLEIILEKGE